MTKQLLYIIFGFIFFHKDLLAQKIPVSETNLSRKYSFIHPVLNVISHAAELDSFYQKLNNIKKTGEGVVSIVHIGDSHIQADFLSGYVRSQLQNFFGNAGRGIVFPYQLAQTNAPSDIVSISGVRWQFNRLAHPEIPISYGVSGYGIRTNSDNASFAISLRRNAGELQSFDHLQFFFDSSANQSWSLQPNNSDTNIIVRTKEDSSIDNDVILGKEIYGFTLSSTSIETPKQFYGVSLINSSPGIIYHTIGVNGARYDHYNKAELFWKQLPALNADLYIISLGTNEAQASSFSSNSFLNELSVFIERLKLISPHAPILITTAPDSYKHRRYNSVLKQINTSITSYCDKENIPVWDLYRITNGYSSAYNWYKRGLMNRDRIHFTAEGYRIQGNLLFNAIAKGYNNYIGTNAD